MSRSTGSTSAVVAALVLLVGGLSGCVIDGMDPAARAQAEGLIGAEPAAGLVSDGPLTEQQASAPWAPIYVEFGGARSAYEELFGTAICPDARRAFDDADSRLVQASDAGEAAVASARDLREAAGLLANRLGCDGFHEFGRWVP